MISIIATTGINNEIGKNNKLLFPLRSDLKFFKKLTINHTVVMGRKTYESLNRVFPNRYNIVVSKSLKRESGVEIVNKIEDILSRFQNTEDDTYIVGGASLYNYFLPYAEKIYLTEINGSKEADVYFPLFNKDSYEKTIIDEGEENGIFYQHVLYRKK